MNQFSSIYGQLFCCNCPGGLSANRCNNRTGIASMYPLLVSSSYAWIAGFLSFLCLSIFCIVGTLYCCKRHRRMQSNGGVSVIHFPSATPGAEDGPSQIQALVPTTFDNTGYIEDTVYEGKDLDVTVAMSHSDDSLDSSFPHQNVNQESTGMETKLLSQEQEHEVCS